MPNRCAGGVSIAPRQVIALLLLAALATPLSLAVAPPTDLPPAVPRVLEGYSIAPLAPLPGITAVTFGPGDDLFATVITGDVMRVHLAWTDAGPVATDITTHARGFRQPLGLAFDDEGALYVADSGSGAESGRVDGRVWKLDESGKTLIVGALPNGRHNTNNLRFGPDDRLYIANGNPNDNGQDGQADVFPYSGAILSVDVDEVSASPAILRWRDESGARIAPDDIASHPLNADFAAKVQVLAWGFRNVYDVAFSPSGIAYTATNGADYPDSQDLFYKVAPGTDYGFPFCFVVGTPGGTDARVENNPLFPDHDCTNVPPAAALLGWHTCATGLDVPPAESPFGHAAFVGECSAFWVDAQAEELLADPTTASHSTSHKVVRVPLDENGDARPVEDFITGLALPTDVHFGPDGAMYVADIEMVYRVAALPAAPAAQAGGPAPVGAPVVAGPGAIFAGYATRAVVAAGEGSLTFVNADAFQHNVVAMDAYGPDDEPWCAGYRAGRCPLFWTPLIGLGDTAPVQGLENLEPLKRYTFYCSIHPGMQGTLVGLPVGA